MTDNASTIDININSSNQPNEETISAIAEAEMISKDPSVKGFTDINDLLAELYSYSKYDT